MTLKEFCLIAQSYYTIDCETSNIEVIDASFTTLRFAYNSLSAEDKEMVICLCDARLTDLFY